MKTLHTIIRAFILLSFLHLNADWQDHWINAQNLCSLQKYEEAELEFDKSISALGETNIKQHPYALVDRGRLCYLIGKNYKALEDLNTALNCELNECDYEKALVTKIMVCSLLNMDDEVLKDLDKLKNTSNYPKEEISENRIIIRNIPKCECYKKIMSSYFISIGVCKSETDIHYLPSGIMIVERNKSLENCTECKENTKFLSKTDSEVTCYNYCQKASVAGASFCAQTFKTYRCQLACLYAVDYLKDGCNWCCKGGGFYKNCVKPFSDIVGKIGTPCDPAWD